MTTVHHNPKELGNITCLRTTTKKKHIIMTQQFLFWKMTLQILLSYMKNVLSTRLFIVALFAIGKYYK